ncbi:hypothetical protein [Microbacterium sp. C7(2022)]|uniref:hypothetical protein n=1 Tax=Microbacterium sp. C7(2022) TaxID=2992759 RepID=UPI00237BE900|nr:hypothetical protein [Microbacterium sp. C7(2022)]
MNTIPHPLFRDPVFDGAADPTLIWNRREKAWWMIYTNRRAWSPPIDDVSWVHGTDLGIATSTDGGISWLYRGIVEGLNIEPGRHTYWAPEIFDDGESYHMYVSFVAGVPTRWEGHARTIRHYTSPDLIQWTYQSTLALGSDRVIDACVYRLSDGRYRMWFKDEADEGHTHFADSDDLFSWTPRGLAVGISSHEGPNVFRLGDAYWMLVDEWAGLRVLRSDDLLNWEAQDRILDVPGTGDDDQTNGQHADVVVSGDAAHVFYFTHPERDAGGSGNADYRQRRTSIHVALARVVNDRLVCDRDEQLAGPILPNLAN